MNDPYSQAHGLAQLGRHGDSMLMHVNPEEVQGLQSLAQANGTSLTTNPYTGQPEAFNFRSMLKTAAPIAAGFAFGPAAGAAMGMGATAGGIAAGALTGGAIAAMSNENILGGALMGGLSGMGGSGLRTAAGSVAGSAAGDIAKANAGTLATEQAAAAQFARNPLTPKTFMPGGGNVAQSTLAANMPSPLYTHNMPGSEVISGTQFDLYNAANPPPVAPPPPSTTDALKAFKDPGAVATEFGGGNKLLGYGKMAGIGGMPLLAGYEPPTFGASEGEFEPPYDPTRRLDLEGIDTGLRLLANGGDVGFGEGEGDFVAGNFAAGDFAGDDTFGEFAEVTQAGQFDDFNQFDDFANDPLLQNPNNFNFEVNQPLPPINDTQSFTELTETFSPGRFIEGAGDGLSDSIPANIDGQQEARLSDGEFVIPADVVSGIGNGSSDAGSAKLFDMMSKIRKRRTGGTAQPDGIRPSDMSL